MANGIVIHRQRAAGLTLLEMLIAIAVVGVVAAIAIPSYAGYLERARVAVAIADIKVISLAITRYMDDNKYTLPETLAGVSMADKLDPWGRAYVYTNLIGVKGKGSARKDKKLNPLNSDFDLYSVGKDGDSKLPLSPKVSEDDVIRARDGRFVGLAKDFDP